MKLKNSIGFSVCLAIAIASFNGCKKKEETEEVKIGESSYSLIQKKIFNVNCTGCHNEQNASFAQHKLSLTEGQSYANLFNAEPAHSEAKTDGLKRVTPKDPDNSLLYNKLLCRSGEHQHHKLYGDKMPAGGMKYLSVGQIEYIRKWILEGASKESTISADASLLNDTTSSCVDNFVPLAPPAAGTGYQMKVDEFQVPSDFEREIFVLKSVGNTKEEYVNKVQLRMRTSSHHFLANTFIEETPAEIYPTLNTIRELRDAQGKEVMPTLQQMQYHGFAFGSQTSEAEFQFPEGVALKIPANYSLDLNLHYVNKTSTPLPGEGYLNLYTTPAATVKHEALPIFLVNDELHLPAQTKTTIVKTFTVPENETWNVFALTSHTHKLGEKFVIKLSGGTRDGEVVFTSTDWSHPEFKKFAQPIVLKGGEGLTMEVVFNNTSNQTVTWGLKSTDEMAIIFGYYYK